MRPLAATVALLALSAPARSQDAPPAPRPKRDVAITYLHLDAPPPGLPKLRTRLLISAATGRQRSENSGTVGILDRPARRRYLFVTNPQDPASGVVTEQDAEDERDPRDIASDPGFELTRGGEARFANQPCTLWSIRDRQAPPDEVATLCISADGLPLMQELRAGGQTSRMEAVSVEYGPLDPSLFAPPPGWPVRR